MNDREILMVAHESMELGFMLGVVIVLWGLGFALFAFTMHHMGLL